MLKAVIFDLDGVIVDTAEHHYLAWRQLAEELGLPCPPERKDQVRGISRREALRIVIGRETSTEEEAETLMARKNSYYRQLVEKIGPHDLLPGVKAFLADLKRHGILIAVATVSQNARAVLSRLGILDELDALTDGFSTRRSKPAPDVFLHAAGQLGVPPTECLVIEDAAAGVEGAKAAGMWAIGLGPEERFRNTRPDFVLPTLEGMTYEGLISCLEAALAQRESWLVQEPSFVPKKQRQMETVFTVGNGYLGTRGSLEEGYPGDLPATLIAGLYDDAPLVHTELVNAPNWTVLRIDIEQERFCLAQGEVLSHRRTLDLSCGILKRHVRWRSPKGHTVELVFERWASMDNPHLCALRLLVTALDFEGELEVQGIIDGVTETPGVLPPHEVGLSHWQPLDHGFPRPRQAYLRLSTKRSHIELCAAIGLEVEGPGETRYAHCPCPRQPGVNARFRLRKGETAVVTKLAAFFTSSEANNPLDEALDTLNQAVEQGYPTLLRAHRSSWQGLWETCDVQIEGDPDVQTAVRFNLYQLLIAAPHHSEHVSIPAKTLSGFGYRGHIFWDTDVFMLPFFALTQPKVAKNLLLYRYRTLPGARTKAHRMGYQGALYAWESAAEGRETTPRWLPSEGEEPIRILCGELEQHVTADVAYAVWFYWQVTADDPFMRDYGAEILLDTAAFWASRVEYNSKQGRYEIRNVMGPDEYHERADNNAYTNALARWNIDAALEVWAWLNDHYPKQASALRGKLGLEEEELARFRDVAAGMYVPHDPDTGLIEQFQGFFRLEDVDLEAYAQRRSSFQALLGHEQVQQSQVIKQPDVLMLLFLLRDRYDLRTKRVNWDYYEPRTDHDFGSSLGPPIHAALGAELGLTEKAYEHFLRAAWVDLKDLRGNTGDGIHAASAGGLWQALVFGFGRLKLAPEGPKAWPRLPEHWERVTFRICYRGRKFLFELVQGTEGPVYPRALTS